jgi:hypothetical protein
MPGFLFEFFEKFLMNANRIHSQDSTSIKLQLAEAKVSEESLRKALTESYE